MLNIKSKTVRLKPNLQRYLLGWGAFPDLVGELQPYKYPSFLMLNIKSKTVRLKPNLQEYLLGWDAFPDLIGEPQANK